MAVNPFDIQAPSATANFGNAADSVSQAQAAQTDTITNSVYNPAAANTYNAADMNANGYNAAQALGNNWNVTDNQTVQGQLTGLIASNSPLMQQAQTSAMQDMNRRGLYNSSMAIGAGQDAVIRNALPIAQADAATYANSAKYAADVANTIGQFNVGQTNTAQQYNANALNQAAAANQAAQNTAAQYNAGNLTDMSKFNASSGLQNAQFNAQQENAVRESNAARTQQTSLANADATNKALAQQIDNSFKAAIASADNTTKIQLQEIDASTRENLAGIEAQYKQLMQSTASASELYQQALKNINDVMMNPDLEAATVQTAINNQMNALKNGLAVVDAMNNDISGLQDLITFSA
jgi:hypothetical protein